MGRAGNQLQPRAQTFGCIGDRDRFASRLELAKAAGIYGVDHGFVTDLK